MTSPQPDATNKKTGKPLLFGRHLAPLAGPWIACLTIAGAVLFFEKRMPVFHDVVQIVYFILGVVLVIVTGRWFRIRRGGPRDSRSKEDRRKSERRGGDV